MLTIATIIKTLIISLIHVLSTRILIHTRTWVNIRDLPNDSLIFLLFLINDRGFENWDSLSSSSLFRLIWYIFIITGWTYYIWILNLLLILSHIHCDLLDINRRYFCYSSSFIITTKRSIKPLLQTWVTFLQSFNVLLIYHATFFTSRFVISCRIKWNFIILGGPVFINILELLHITVVIRIIWVLSTFHSKQAINLNAIGRFSVTYHWLWPLYLFNIAIKSLSGKLSCIVYKYRWVIIMTSILSWRYIAILYITLVEKLWFIKQLILIIKVALLILSTLSSLYISLASSIYAR